MVSASFLGRRIHIVGSVSEDPGVATAQEVESARIFLVALVDALIRRGASFVIPVDAEPLRSGDGLPITFDWLVWEAVYTAREQRPDGARDPFAIAVQHHKTEHQIPERFAEVWDTLRTSDAVQIENVSHWNMGSKRMEAQARWGDVLVTLGGSDGVLFLANLYHDAGKPVVPLNFGLCAPTEGSLKLFDLGLASSEASRLFRASGRNAHAWMNRINHSHRIPIAKRVEDVLEVLEAIERPQAFAVRLLNPNHGDFDAVDTFYQEVAKTFVEDELGYDLVVVDGKQPYEYARIDEEIFRRLHRSSLVIADLTGSRPNCYLELGYALGRGLQTMVTAKAGTEHPFDIATLAAHHWEPEGTQSARINALRQHWAAIEKRPPLVPECPLIR